MEGLEAGSGKSHSIIQALVYFILRDFNEPFQHKILCLRKTSPAARKSIFPLIKHVIEAWGLEELVKINNTEMLFTFLNGSTIMVGGLDNEDKLKSIYGITKAFLEEINEFKADDFRQLNLRLRGLIPTTFQIFGAFNPLSKLSWVYKEFFVKDNSSIYKHHSTYKDNEYLDEEYINNLKRLVEEDDNYYKIYTLGEWGSLADLVFTNWEVIPEWVEPEGEVVYGLDQGFVHNTAIVRVGEYKDGFIVDELLCEAGLTTSDLIDELDNIIDNKSDYMYADSARPEMIEEIFRADYNCHPCKKGQGSVKDGIDYIKGKRLYITQDSVNLISEIMTYSYKKDKQGNLIEEPVKFNDDLVDSVRYAVFSHFANRTDYTIVE